MTRLTALLILLALAVTLLLVSHRGPSNGERHSSTGPRLDALLVAIDSKDAKSLHEQLEDPSLELNRADGYQTTPLIYAVACGWADGVRCLLDRRADPSLCDRMGYTPLLYVVQAQPPDSRQIVELLIHHGADVNRRGPDGQTPLRLAVQMARKDLVRQFIAAGANVNAADDRGITALHTAAIVDQPEIVTLLLSAGANPNARDDQGDRPIDNARECDAPGALKRLQNAR